ncbi:MAG: DNA repair protein RadA, partial [Ectothiorhodospiraceae bacterium]
MAKTRSVFVCQECGADTPKWAGQCPECGAWNTLEETAGAVVAGAGSAARGQYAGDRGVRTLADVPRGEEQRVSTGLGELDRVLGGGMVP